MGPKGKKRNFSLFGDFGRERAGRATLQGANRRPAVDRVSALPLGQAHGAGRAMPCLQSCCRLMTTWSKFLPCRACHIPLMPGLSNPARAELVNSRRCRACLFPFVLSLSKHEHNTPNCALSPCWVRGSCRHLQVYSAEKEKAVAFATAF